MSLRETATPPPSTGEPATCSTISVHFRVLGTAPSRVWPTRHSRCDISANVHDRSSLLLIWLLQQAPIGSVEGCPDRRFRRRYANFKPTSPAKRPASSTWRLVAGPMVSSVLDADIGEPTNW